MPDDNDLAWRIDHDVLDSRTDHQATVTLLQRCTEQNRIGVVFDRLINDCRTGRPCLKQFSLDCTSPVVHAGAAPLLSFSKDLFATLNLQWKLCIEGHGLDHFDNIDKGDFGDLLAIDLVDNFKQALVFCTSGHRHDDASKRGLGFDGSVKGVPDIDQNSDPWFVSVHSNTIVEWNVIAIN